MALLVFALIVLLIAGIAAMIARRFLPEFADIATGVILLVAVIVIAQRAGLF